MRYSLCRVYLLPDGLSLSNISLILKIQWVRNLLTLFAEQTLRDKRLVLRAQAVLPAGAQAEAYASTWAQEHRSTGGRPRSTGLGRKCVQREDLWSDRCRAQPRNFLGHSPPPDSPDVSDMVGLHHNLEKGPKEHLEAGVKHMYEIVFFCSRLFGLVV